MSSSDPAYRLADVAFGYDEEPVLRDLSGCVQPGELLGILGPNGEGKSTLLRVLLGVLRPRAGAVELFGRPLRRIPPIERAKVVGYLPQEVGLTHPFTTFEVVLMGRYPHLATFALESARDIEIAHGCMERTGVEHLARRRFSTLSGGERQRALIASVLAQEPRVMLLDEPTAALDLTHQYTLMEMLRGLADEGITVILVTHDVTLAAAYCRRLWLLSGGRVLAEGSPREVINEANLSQLYGADLRVTTDPATGLPMILPPIPSEAQSCP